MLAWAMYPQREEVTEACGFITTGYRGLDSLYFPELQATVGGGGSPHREELALPPVCDPRCQLLTFCLGMCTFFQESRVKISMKINGLQSREGGMKTLGTSASDSIF